MYAVKMPHAIRYVPTASPSALGTLIAGSENCTKAQNDSANAARPTRWPIFDACGQAFVAASHSCCAAGAPSADGGGFH